MAVDRAEVERCLAVGDLSRALQLSSALVAAQPADAELQVLHAATLMAKGDWAGATMHLQQALRASDAPYAAKARLALCQTMLGDRPGALAAFRLALDERPEDFVQRLGYAETLEAEAGLETALPDYFRAVCDAQKHGRWLNDASTPPHLRDRVRRAMDTIDHGRQALFAQVIDAHLAAFGPDAMRRVRKALAMYLGTVPVAVADPRQQPKFFRFPDLPTTPYFERALFPWYETLEAAADAIRDELLAVFDEPLTPFLGTLDATTAASYLGGDPQRRSWDAYFLHRHGKRFDEHLARCPRTAQVLEQVPLTVVRDHAPEVLFSVLAPDTHIKPHYGVTNTRVVTHLPLIIPEGDCRLVVGGMEHAWREGRCITFDDTYLHEAWNRSGQRRVVMILDTWNPYLTPEERVVVKDLIERIGDFNANAMESGQNMR